MLLLRTEILLEKVLKTFAIVVLTVLKIDKKKLRRSVLDNLDTKTVLERIITLFLGFMVSISNLKTYAESM